MNILENENFFLNEKVKLLEKRLKEAEETIDKIYFDGVNDDTKNYSNSWFKLASNYRKKWMEKIK